MKFKKLQEEFLKTINRFGKIKYELLFHNVSRREYEMLAVMERFMHESGNRKGIYVSELAKILRVSSPAVSRMIGILETKGFIVRDVDKEDRRNTYVYLTKSGTEARKKNEAQMDKVMHRIMTRMGENNMKELIILWNQLADIMEEELRGEKYV